MNKAMLLYPIYKTYNREKFAEACAAIERLNGIKKGVSLEDVDCSQIQMYYYQGKKIRVLNGVDEDAVIVDSEINLDGVFGSEIRGKKRKYPPKLL